MRKQNVLRIVLLLVIIGMTTPMILAAQETFDDPLPTLGDFDPDSLEGIDPSDYPILPVLTDFARTLFERGQARAIPRAITMFSKVGDSMTASPHFLVPFGDGDYDLGEYVALETVIEFFVTGNENAFNRVNYANSIGFTTASALDSTWAVADVCIANETPLACEYRVSNAAFALIMFGTNDVMAFDAPLFDYFLRRIVLETAAADVIPVLYTMPIRPEAAELSGVFNQIILKIAGDYDVPVINLAVALEPLLNGGVDLQDTLHLTEPEPPLTVTTFTDESLNAGYTVRNLVTLQALDVLLTHLNS